MAKKPLKTPVSPMAFMFAQIWDAFLANTEIGYFELETLIEQTGFAVWGEATREEVKESGADLEVGDAILRLTEAGKAIIAEGRRMK